MESVESVPNVRCTGKEYINGGAKLKIDKCGSASLERQLNRNKIESHSQIKEILSEDLKTNIVCEKPSRTLAANIRDSQFKGAGIREVLNERGLYGQGVRRTKSRESRIEMGDIAVNPPTQQQSSMMMNQPGSAAINANPLKFSYHERYGLPQIYEHQVLQQQQNAAATRAPTPETNADLKRSMNGLQDNIPYYLQRRMAANNKPSGCNVQNSGSIASVATKAPNRVREEPLQPVQEASRQQSDSPPPQPESDFQNKSGFQLSNDPSILRLPVKHYVINKEQTINTSATISNPDLTKSQIQNPNLCQQTVPVATRPPSRSSQSVRPATANLGRSAVSYDFGTIDQGISESQVRLEQSKILQKKWHEELKTSFYSKKSNGLDPVMPKLMRCKRELEEVEQERMRMAREHPYYAQLGFQKRLDVNPSEPTLNRQYLSNIENQREAYDKVRSSTNVGSAEPVLVKPPSEPVHLRSEKSVERFQAERPVTVLSNHSECEPGQLTTVTNEPVDQQNESALETTQPDVGHQQIQQTAEVNS